MVFMLQHCCKKIERWIHSNQNERQICQEEIKGKTAKNPAACSATLLHLHRTNVSQMPSLATCFNVNFIPFARMLIWINRWEIEFQKYDISLNETAFRDGETMAFVLLFCSWLLQWSLSTDTMKEVNYVRYMFWKFVIFEFADGKNALAQFTITMKRMKWKVR